jgi:hypothetical protein
MRMDELNDCSLSRDLGGDREDCEYESEWVNSKMLKRKRTEVFSTRECRALAMSRVRAGRHVVSHRRSRFLIIAILTATRVPGSIFCVAGSPEWRWTGGEGGVG